jgi:hypothetical protein
MEMSLNPDEIIKQYAEGQTKAGLDWSFEKIKELVIKFINKGNSFLEDVTIISSARKDYSSDEMKLYKKYVLDKDLRKLIGFGITLRKITDLDKRFIFRNIILGKFKTNGLHTVQFVENGLLSELIAFSSKEDLGYELNEVLQNIEKYVLFVQTTDDFGLIQEKIKIKIHCNNPYIFIISATGSAIKILKNCEDKIKSLLNNYKLKKIIDDECENFFFRLIP